jgi:uncharacterized protein YgiM (DUF1202 family)
MTTALLAVTVGVVGAAATPALLRAAGVEIPVAAAPSSDAPLALPRQPPEIRGALPDPSLEADDEEALPHPAGQLGLTRGSLVLRENPAQGAGVVGKVGGGELVTILRLQGDWALVYYGGGGNLVAGWARKNEIAIR